MEKENNDMKGKNNKVQEPTFPYNKIRKSSFEELEEENLLYSLSLSPLQRFAYLMELNINAFGRSSLEIKKQDKIIYKR